MGGQALHPAIATVAAAALGRDDLVAGLGRPVDRGVQRQLLADVMDSQGPEGLLRAGRHLDTVATEPLVLALLNTDGPGMLIGKIDRLNRFLHSHHRHRVHRLESDQAELEHWSMSGVPPTPAESLFACGLYLELLSRIGCRGVTCAFPEADTGESHVYRDGHPMGPPDDHTGRWRIGWTTTKPSRLIPGLDDLLLRSIPVDLTDRSSGSLVAAVLRTDLSRTWKVATVASRLAVSPRTLQRHLRREGESFTGVVRRVRVAAAQDLLQDPTRSATDIGYVTGFADAAHFARTFKLATGVTPNEWRQKGPVPTE